MEYYKVSDNIFVMYPIKADDPKKSAANTVPTTCFTLPNELVFIDCGTYPDLSSKFRFDMETKFKRKTSHLLLTHLHWDHFLAMETFNDINIVAPE
ncbi:MAG: hypothetical protein ACFFG0_36930 [Candidatus Thorarchaeota archaeon]